MDFPIFLSAVILMCLTLKIFYGIRHRRTRLTRPWAFRGRIDAEQKRLAALSPHDLMKFHEERAHQETMLREERVNRSTKNIEVQWGKRNPHIVCPHCQKTGQVRTKTVVRKRGLSGGKVTAAYFTLGWSLLATGLARKEKCIAPDSLDTRQG